MKGIVHDVILSGFFMHKTIFNRTYGKKITETSWFRFLLAPKPGEAGFFVLLIYGSILFAVLGLGFWFSYNEHIRETEELKESLAQWVQITATTLQEGSLQRLKGDLSDEQIPDYHYLEQHLQAFRRLRHDVRFVYLLGIRNGVPFFYGDSEPEHSPEKSRPGDPFPELPPEAIALFDRGGDAVVALYKDRWGEWLSSFARLRLNSRDGTPFVLGVDLHLDYVRYRILNATLRPLYLMGAVQIGLLIIGLAILKLRSLALLLASSERAFHDLAVNISDHLWQTDEKMQFTYCSDRIKEILGYEVSEMLGRSMLEFVAPEDRERVTCFLKEAFAAKQSFRQLECWCLTREGDRVCLVSSGSPVMDSAGNFCGFRGVDSNITEKRKIEDLLARRDQLLEAATKSGEVLLNEADHAIAARDALRTLGVAIEADRAYLCAIEHVSEEKDHALRLLCACDCAFLPGEMKEPNPPTLNRTNLISRWYDTLYSGLPMAAHVKDLPDAEQYLLSLRGTQSILLVPIMMKGALWGMACFEACAALREWTLGEIMILLTTVSSIGTTLVRKKAEDSSRRNDVLVKGLLAISDDLAIVATTPDGMVTLYNAGAQKLFGYSEDEVVNKFPLLMFHVLPEVEEVGKTLAISGDPVWDGFSVLVEGACRKGIWKQEWTYVTKNGSRIRALTSIAELRDEAGERWGILNVIQPLPPPS